MKLHPIAIAAAFAAETAGAQIPRPDDAPKPLSPEQSAAAFRLPDGFRMEAVAGEPLISSPSGVCWDEHGRMFVGELHGYNLAGQLDIEELNRTGKLDTQVRRVQADAKFKKAAEKGTFGAVKYLTDSDGDGRMDRAALWADDLPPVYGIVPARGGIIAACAPHIIFLADRDGDGKAEVREILFTGFGTGELERGINAPQWGADGWIYFGRGWDGGSIIGPKLAGPVKLPGSDFRIRADGSAIEPVTGHTHTFGFTFTEAGDRFTVTTTTSYFVAPLPWHYLVRNPDTAAGDVMAATGDRRAFSLSSPHPWRRKRAEDAAYFEFYRSRYGAAESEAGGWFTAMCGPLVYQDHALPGLHGQYFVCEPSGNLIHREILSPDGPLLTLHRVPGEEQSEFAASTDSWSHPIHLLHGPDGGIWVVDYYREIIEDYSAIPRHLQQQYGLYAGHDRGRIYRLTHRDAPAAPDPDMAKLTPEALARECAGPLLWRRTTARRLLVERGTASAAPVLRELLNQEHAASAGLITVLRTLDQLGALTPQDAAPFLNHPEPSVRIQALQISDHWLKQNQSPALLEATLAAAAAEQTPRVLIQFALSLGESPAPPAFTMLARYAREHLGVRWMDAALLSSLTGRGGEMLAALIREPGAAIRLIGPLAQAVAARRDENELSQTLDLTVSAAPGIQISVMEALAKGRKNAPRQPLVSATAGRAIATMAASPEAALRAAARALEESFVPAEAESPANGPAPVPAPAMEVSDAVFRKFVGALDGPRDATRGREVFRQHCMVCHRIEEEGHPFGPDLLGELGVAEETLVRHLLLPAERIRPGYETTLVEIRDAPPAAGLLKDDGATAITLSQPGGGEQVILRKDVTGVRRLSASLMPSFAEVLTPSDLASLLAWLRSLLKPETDPPVILFDEQQDFAGLLTRESGTATVKNTGAAFGKYCLHITPPQRAANQIPGWDYRIVEKPAAPNEFRYLRLSWRAAGDGVMVEIASAAQWPKPEDANGRYFAGRNTTPWQAREISPRPPREWDTVTFDLWKDMGTFTLTGIAPTAMGGGAWFDRIELLRKR